MKNRTSRFVYSSCKERLNCRGRLLGAGRCSSAFFGETRLRSGTSLAAVSRRSSSPVFQDGRKEDFSSRPGGEPAADPGPGHTPAPPQPPAGGAGEGQLPGRPARQPAPAGQASAAVRRQRGARQEEEEDQRRPLQAALPQELPGTAGGAEPECERGSELPVCLRPAVQAAPEALLRCLRVPLQLHLCVLRGALLLRPLPGHAPGDQVPEVDIMMARR